MRFQTERGCASWIVVVVFAAVIQFPWIIDHDSQSLDISLERSSMPVSPRLLTDGFVENRGQVAEGIRYYSNGDPAVAFRDDGVMIVIRGQSGGWGRPTDFRPLGRDSPERGGAESLALLVRFEGGNRVTPAATGRLPTRNSFFVGSDPSAWKTDVPSYMDVSYRNLYDGIDLSYRLTEAGLKYEFIVRPSADPSAIALSYEGATALSVADGQLLVETPLGAVRDAIPHSYDGSGRKVDCAFVLRDARSAGIACRGWNRESSLVVDPLVYSTYLGSNEPNDRSTQNHAWGIAVDDQGNAYVTGHSEGFPPTPGSFGNRGQVFVAKLDPSGRTLVYSAVFGSGYPGGGEMARAIAIDAWGNAYVTGFTLGSDFPTTESAFDRTCGTDGHCDGGGIYDAFVTKLSAEGNALMYSTYLGGSRSDLGWALAVDGSGSAYVTGVTFSTDFPVTPGSYDTSFNGGEPPWSADVFAVKLTVAGDALAYGTYLGGGGDEDGFSIAVDGSGSAYVTGRTASPDYPTTPEAFDTMFGPNGLSSVDTFVTKLDPIGTTLRYSTFLDGDWGNSIAVDRFGQAYVAGTDGSNAAVPTTPNAYDQDHNGGQDIFLVKFDALGREVLFATYLGGSDWDEDPAVALDSEGNAYLTGRTMSQDFPVTDFLDPSHNGGWDAFVAILDRTGSSLLHSAFLGGRFHDYGTSLAVSASGLVYVAGLTTSDDFPTTPGAFDRTKEGETNAFVAALTTESPSFEAGPTPPLHRLSPDPVAIPKDRPVLPRPRTGK